MAQIKIFEMVGRTKYEHLVIDGVCVLVEQIKRAPAGARSCTRVRKVLTRVGGAPATTFLVGNFSGVPGFYVFPEGTPEGVVRARKEGFLACCEDLTAVAQFCANRAAAKVAI